MQACDKQIKTELAKVSYYPKDNIWLLREQYCYPDENKKAEVILYECFHFDLASIPRFFWRIVAIHELSLEATLVHDFMYMSRGGEKKFFQEKKGILGNCVEEKEILGKIEPLGIRYSRKEADDLFLKMMEDSHVNRYRRFLSYIGVRIFGIFYWRPEWLDKFLR